MARIYPLLALRGLQARLTSARDVLLGKRAAIYLDDYERLFKAGQIRSSDGIYMTTRTNREAQETFTGDRSHGKPGHEPSEACYYCAGSTGIVGSASWGPIGQEPRCARTSGADECMQHAPCPLHECSISICSCSLPDRTPFCKRLVGNMHCHAEAPCLLHECNALECSCSTRHAQRDIDELHEAMRRVDPKVAQARSEAFVDATALYLETKARVEAETCTAGVAKCLEAFPCKLHKCDAVLCHCHLGSAKPYVDQTIARNV